MSALCALFDPAAVSLEHVACVYEAFARMEKLVAGARLRLAARVEESTCRGRTRTGRSSLGSYVVKVSARFGRSRWLYVAPHRFALSAPPSSRAGFEALRAL